MPYSPNITANSIKSNATSIAGEVERMMARWNYFADSLETLDAATLNGLGLDANYQAYLGSLRVALKNIVLRYKNEAPLNADSPQYFVKQFADLTVF